ncbi:hypothetical protein LTR13_010348 [Exophiala sideris]|uniref:EF-hand domain-containing protein n=1 Tax=Exophiala sideris TaxID=1016849 RepID=A0ABR0IX58_9EURO|nr:hypothetical protein LTR13_010348 [Exophiala sideris]KAK5050248.1 hypothetical protein LTR69_010736 [Exophiala sideris]
MKVIVVGAGLGGLACAIACRQGGLDVLILERAPKILPVGAGIQVSPNASRIARRLGILPKLLAIAIEPEQLEMRRYDTGNIIHIRPGREGMREKYGAPWFVIHRADYHEVMLETAKDLGVEVRLGCNVEHLDFISPQVTLSNGETLKADVIVGADGDLAYRATLPYEYIKSLHDPEIDELCQREVVSVWLGPEKHCVFYPIQDGKVFNLVLLRPDNMPSGARTEKASLEEMRQSFDGWHPMLTRILSKIVSVLKWKLCHHEELATWTKGSVALLGDACHPTLPYQGQGAAMAVEDGASLGRLLREDPTCGLFESENHCALDKFEAIDTNHDGIVTLAEILAGLEVLRPYLASSGMDEASITNNVTTLFNTYDTDKNGNLTFAEALAPQTVNV